MDDCPLHREQMQKDYIFDCVICGTNGLAVYQTTLYFNIYVKISLQFPESYCQ